MKKMCFIFLIFPSLAIVLNAQQTSTRDYAMTIPIKFHRAIAAIYRKTTKEELETIKPDPADTAKYAEFLRQSNTGLIRLMKNSGCAENTKIIIASSDCQKYTMPGAGSSYSFRAGDYRIQRLSDISFSGASLYTSGLLTHSILTKIGDIPLDNINLEHKAVNFLQEFQPTADYEQAQKFNEQLNKGITRGEYVYQGALNASENTTYILRSIAYNGELRRAVNGISYNELLFDKRKDTIIIFRIVRKAADNSSITLLWKKLLEKDAPKIRSQKE